MNRRKFLTNAAVVGAAGLLPLQSRGAASTKARAQALIRDSLVVDSTLPNAPHLAYVGVNPAFSTYLNKYIESGFNWVSLTVATDTPRNLQATVLAVADSRKWVLSQPDRLVMVDTMADVYRAKSEGKLAISFNFQGTNPFATSLSLVGMFKDLGVHHALIAYNQKNHAGDGAYEKTNAGLSRYGVNLIKEMNRVGMVLDVSHTGYRSAMEAIEVSSKPVIMSHSNPVALHQHPRNVPDEQIKAMAATGGVIGVVPINVMTNGKSDSASVGGKEMFRHIDHIVQLVGADHVGLGLDYVEDTDLMLKIIKANPDMYPADQRIKVFLSRGPDVVSEMTESMLRAGYTDNVVKKILGENWLRVFNAVLG